jgi:hypothetical protein
MVTVVAQWAKAPGIHCYVAGSIPAVTPRYCTKKNRKMLFGAQKNKGKKIYGTRIHAAARVSIHAHAVALVSI